MTGVTSNKLMRDYFEWLCGLVCDDRHPFELYSELLSYMFGTEFTYVIDMDGNRYEDGISLRYRFGNCFDLTDTIVNWFMSESPCSVLEMMIALCIRCEEHIMSDPDVGDRTSTWFWDMVDSLGLIGQTNSRIRPERVQEVLADFLDRNYDPDGHGGLFTLRHSNVDLRDVEIWCQMMWYLNDLIERRH